MYGITADYRTVLVGPWTEAAKSAAATCRPKPIAATHPSSIKTRGGASWGRAGGWLLLAALCGINCGLMTLMYLTTVPVQDLYRIGVYHFVPMYSRQTYEERLERRGALLFNSRGCDVIYSRRSELLVRNNYPLSAVPVSIFSRNHYRDHQFLEIKDPHGRTTCSGSGWYQR